MNDLVAYHRYTPPDLADALRDTAPLDNQLRVDDVHDFLALKIPPRARSRSRDVEAQP